MDTNNLSYNLYYLLDSDLDIVGVSISLKRRLRSNVFVKPLISFSLYSFRDIKGLKESLSVLSSDNTSAESSTYS